VKSDGRKLSSYPGGDQGASGGQYRFEFALWTRQIIQTLLKEEWKLKLSLRSVGRLLKQLGLRCQRPLFKASEQDAQRVNRWLEQEYQPVTFRPSLPYSCQMSRIGLAPDGIL